MSAPVHVVQPLSRPPDAAIAVPGSKSHTNRALICAALAPGRSRLGRVLFADDTEAMMHGLRELGVDIDANPRNQEVTVDGGIGDLRSVTAERPRVIDVRKSGTTSRFLLPLLAATPGRFVLDGHGQLRSRPFGPQLKSLRALGAEVTGDGLPLAIHGKTLEGATVAVSSSMSSQFLSGLLLTAPMLTGSTTIVVEGELVSRPYVDLTVATMATFGVEVDSEVQPAGSDRGEFDSPASGSPAPGSPASEKGGAQTFGVGSTSYRPADLELEPDASAASYFFAAAAITGGRVRVDGLGRDTVQGDLRFVDVLQEMGAEVTFGPDWTEVAGTGALRGVTVDMANISDTAQTLAVVAAFADSPTRIDGIGFVRFKETDRIQAVVTELGRLGIEVSATGDGMIVHPGTPRPGLVETYEDHRMAMSFALLGLVHPGIRIDNPSCVNKTFPDFFTVLDRLR